MNADKIVKKAKNNKKASIHSNPNSQISIKDCRIERGMTPKQSGQK